MSLKQRKIIFKPRIKLTTTHTMHFVITDYVDKNVTKMRITFKTESLATLCCTGIRSWQKESLLKLKCSRSSKTLKKINSQHYVFIRCWCLLIRQWNFPLRRSGCVTFSSLSKYGHSKRDFRFLNQWFDLKSGLCNTSLGTPNKEWWPTCHSHRRNATDRSTCHEC